MKISIKRWEITCREIDLLSWKLIFLSQTEQIRRANKLWATDSLFLREYLLIPMPVDNPLSMQSIDAPTETETNHTIASVSLHTVITNYFQLNVV